MQLADSVRISLAYLIKTAGSFECWSEGLGSTFGLVPIAATRLADVDLESIVSTLDAV